MLAMSSWRLALQESVEILKQTNIIYMRQNIHLCQQVTRGKKGTKANCSCEFLSRGKYKVKITKLSRENILKLQSQYSLYRFANKTRFYGLTIAQTQSLTQTRS